eukprot:maker-scaffold_2-snap-gene-24.34-mRNA-1 protein AED:0.00 eAED:0.00 QI:12/1/1/1/1/1/2/69/196
MDEEKNKTTAIKLYEKKIEDIYPEWLCNISIQSGASPSKVLLISSVAAVVSIIYWLRLSQNIFITYVSIIYPMIKSFKAIEEKSNQETWLKYWSTFALVRTLEDSLLSRLLLPNKRVFLFVKLQFFIYMLNFNSNSLLLTHKIIFPGCNKINFLYEIIVKPIVNKLSMIIERYFSLLSRLANCWIIKLSKYQIKKL